MTIKMMMILSLISSSHEVCPIAYSEELTYWGISELFVEPCCQELYYGRSAFIIIIFFTTVGLPSALMVLLSCVMIRMIIIMIHISKTITITFQEGHDEEGESKGGRQHLCFSKHLCRSHKTMVLFRHQ